jgi:hypothetical protein
MLDQRLDGYPTLADHGRRAEFPGRSAWRSAGERDTAEQLQRRAAIDNAMFWACMVTAPLSTEQPPHLAVVELPSSVTLEIGPVVRSPGDKDGGHTQSSRFNRSDIGSGHFDIGAGTVPVAGPR